ncbi:MAG TPA: O-antigen ligase family protein [Marinobacter antarcticus]|uniref:O-antigen ligase family protein n=2 Tax=root TaxID=1 RepID=A0A831R5F5_9GAMM|nr:O-antigen ligase family protein [Marinobacter antarcticus]
MHGSRNERENSPMSSSPMVKAPFLSKPASWLFQKSHGEKLFVAALAIYIFSYLPALAAYRDAESVMILVFLWLVFVAGRKTGLRSRVLHDPLFLTCVAMLVFLILARLWYTYSLPPGIDPEIRETRYFLKPIMAFLVALGLGVIARPYRWALMFLSILGLAVYLLTTVGTHYWSNALAGRRTDFGIHNAQHTAMFFGAALIGIVCFMARTVNASSSRWRLATMPAVVLTFAVVAFGFTATETRAAWLGLFMAGTIGLVTTASLMWISRKKIYKERTSKAIVVLALLLMFGTLLAGLNTSERFKDPFNHQTLTLEQYFAIPDYNSDPRTSRGVRLLSWRVALEWLKERPLVGWGPGSAEDLIDHSDFFSDWFKKNFGHMHDSFVESLVANGLLGSAIQLAMIIWLGVATFIAHRKGRMPDDVFVFALSFFGFWVAINLFESYILYTTGHYINAVVGGFIYSFYLQSHDEDVNQ